MPMVRKLTIEDWVHATCHDICSANDLRKICQARGFAPPQLKSKEALASFVEMRLTEPQGVVEALTSLDGEALWALHAVRSAGEPVKASALHPYFGYQRSAHWAEEFKQRFDRIREALVNKGLLLVTDSGDDRLSRFARLQVLLPPPVAEALPPLPIPTEPVDPLPTFRDWTEAAAEELKAGLTSVPGAGEDTARRPAQGLMPAARIEKGVLRVGRYELPNAELLHETLFRNWVDAGSTASWRDRPDGPAAPLELPDESDRVLPSSEHPSIRARAYVLRAVPPGHGINEAHLFQAFNKLQAPIPEKDRAAFVEKGERLGFLAVSGEGDRRLLVPNPKGQPADPVPTFAGWRDADNAAVADVKAVSLGDLLTVARVSTLVLEGSALRAVPALRRIGREHETLREDAAIQSLLRHSAAFRQAFDTVAERAGRWVVHDNVTVLKLAGHDIEALLLAEYGPRLTPLGGGWFAICRADLKEILAFVKKRGFKPKMMPQEVVHPSGSPHARKENTR